MQINQNNNMISFKGIVFKNKSLYAKYGNGIVGSIRTNKVVESFKKRSDVDIVFSAENAGGWANFYWQIRKNGGVIESLKNLFLPKVFFKSSQLASKPHANEITQEVVDAYIRKHLNS